jgi:hypothetical protein
MAALTLQTVPVGGIDLGALASAAGGGDTVQVTSHETGGYDTAPAVLIFRNGDASSKTVTCDGTALIVTAGNIGIIPLKTGYGGKNIAVTYSAVTSCTVGAFQLP